MANPRRAATIRLGSTYMASDRGPQVPHYNMPLNMPALYKWVPGSTATVDGVMVLGHSGGTSGRWIRARMQLQGDDLGDGNATIQVGGNLWRVLPAGTLSTNSQLTLGTTNAAEGDIITITRLDIGAYTYAVVNGGPAAGTLTTFPVSTKAFGDFYFNGTNWTPQRAAVMP